MILKINMAFKWIRGGGFKPEGEKEKRKKEKDNHNKSCAKYKLCMT